MKLHLPKSLVTALTAVYAAAPLATTVGAGVLVFSSVSVPKAFADYTWIGGNGTFTDNTEWNKQTNWEETIPTGIVVGVGKTNPSDNDVDGSKAWEKIIFDAGKQTSGELQLTTCQLEGWELKMDVLNGAQVTTSLKKLQGNSDDGIAIKVGEKSTLTINLTGGGNDGRRANFTIESGTDSNSGGSVTLNLGRDKKSDSDTRVTYGDITGNENVGMFTLASTVAGTGHTHTSNLELVAHLTASAVSDTLTRHTVNLAEITGDISFGNNHGIVTSGITAEHFTLSSQSLTESMADIGKYRVFNDGGIIKLEYVTGQWISKTASVNEGEVYDFATLTGANDVHEFTLSVTPTTDVTTDAATITVSEDSNIYRSLAVDGGVVSFSVSEGQSLSLVTLSLTNNAQANFTGEGKVVLTADMIFGSTTGAAGAPAQASDFTGLGTLELAQGVTLSMGTDDTDAEAKRISSVKLANKVIMKEGSKLSINAAEAVINSTFEMNSATIDYTDLVNYGTAELNGNMVISGANTINARWTGNQNYKLNGAISGDGSLTFTRGHDGMRDDYHFLLSGNNTYTGGTIIGNSTHVMITNESALGTGAVTINNNGAIKLQGTAFDATISNTISGAGNITDVGGAYRRDLTFNGDISGWTGTFTRNGNNNGNYGNYYTDLHFTGNAKEINANVTTNAGKTTRINVYVTNDEQVAFNGNINLLINAGDVANRGTLTVNGNGAKTFTGEINVGHLNLRDGEVTFNNTVNVGNDPGCTLTVGTNTTMAALNLQGRATLTHDLTVTGSTTLKGTGAAASGVRINIGEGVTISTENGAWKATGTSSNTAVFTTTADTVVSGSESNITFANADVTYVGSVDATLNAALSGGSLTMNAGETTLSIAKAYTDSSTAMAITSGTVKLEETGTWAGDIVVGTGGTLNLSNSAATTHSNNITVNGNLIVNAQETLTGVVSGSGTTTVNDNLALNNAASSINLVSVADSKKITGTGKIVIVGGNTGELVIKGQLQDHTGTVEIGDGKHLKMAGTGYDDSKGLTQGNITIAAGGKLTLQGGDSLGYKSATAGNPTKIITMTGSSTEKLAQFEVIGSRQTLSTQINLNSNTKVFGTGSLESFNLNAQAEYHFNVTGTNNTVELKLQLRGGGFKINVAEEGKLTFSGVLSHRDEGTNAVLTKSGAGTLFMSNTVESLQTTMGVAVTGGVLQYGGNEAGRGTTGVASVTVSDGATIEYAHTDVSVHTFSGTINLNGANAVMKVSNGNQAQNESGASISGTGKIQVAGGSLELTDANTYSGGTELSGGTLKVSHANALGTGELSMTGGTLSLADGLTTTLNASSLGGTLELGTGSTYKLDRDVTELTALSLAGDAAIGMNADETLITKLRITDSIALNAHILTLDFSTPIASFTAEETSVTDLVTGLTGLDKDTLKIVFAGNEVGYNAADNNWKIDLGRAHYTWALSDSGVLSLNVEAGRAMALVWNGGDGEWNQSSSSWNKESNSESTVFENGDSVRIANTSAITLSGAISTNVLRVDDGATVSFSAKTDIDSDSLHANHIYLGSAYAEGAAVTAGTQSVTLSGLHTTATDLTVEAGKTATLTLSESASLTVNNAITVDTGADFTLNGGGQTIHTGSIAVKQGGTATITGDVSGADNGLSAISTGDGSESALGGKLTITGNVTGSGLVLSAGSNGFIEITGNATGVSSITAGSGAHVLISGDASGSFNTLTAGTGESEYIKLTGNVTIESGNLTINGNATIGNGVTESSGSTFFCGAGTNNNGSLTIASGTTVWKTYRAGVDGTITINAGATLDAGEGVLWMDNGYVRNGTMTVNGTLIVRNLAYKENGHHNESTMGSFHHNAGNFLLGNGAKVVVNEGSTNDQQGMKFNGQETENTYTIVFNEGATSTINFGGGIVADTSGGKKHNLVFEVTQNAIVDLQYNASTDNNIGSLSQIIKTGTGNMTISSLAKGNASFAGGLSVEEGKLTISTALENQLSSVSVAAGSTLNLSNTLSITRSESNRINIGGTADNAATITFGNGGSLSYDGVTYTAKTGFASGTEATISSTGAASDGSCELSFWNSNQSYSNLNISMNGSGSETSPREIKATLNNSDLTLNGAAAGLTADDTLGTLTLEESSTVIVKGSTVSIESATIKSGSKLKAMTAAATWESGANYTMTATREDADASLAHVTLKDTRITGDTSGEGDTMKALGEMSSLTLEFAAANTAAEISNVRMLDVTISNGAVSLSGVVAVASSVAAQAEATPALMMARTLSAETGDAADTKVLTATPVKSNGSVSGDLTVDIAPSILTPENGGKPLEWTIFSNVSLKEGGSFTLKLGDVLKGIVENSQSEVTLSGDWVGNTEHSLVLTSENLGNLSTGNLLQAPVGVDGGNLVLKVSSIPEPTSSTLSVLALAALVARRRRRRK